MNQIAFVESVADALAHLYDSAYLASHAVGRHLSRDGSQLLPHMVHCLLVQAVERLRPQAGSPTSSAAWRRYHYLRFRYLEGVSHEAVAHRLGLSLRQAHRVRLAALGAVAAGLLEEKHGVARTSTERPTHPNAQSRGQPPGAPHASLSDELRRLVGTAPAAIADLTEEVHGAVEVVGPLASNRGVAVEVDAPGDRVTTAVERVVLRQMVVLLLSHALERQTGDRIYLSVAAVDGKPILDVVFLVRGDEPNRAPPAQSSYLATVGHLAEAQGGSLEVLPVKGGTCLRLRLPVDRAVVVLVVDDNPDVARLFRLYLEGTRYRVIQARTAQTALATVGQARPDIIILDVMMPLQDGWEIFRQMRGNPATSNTPIIVCSILPEKDVALALGAADFLAKPVTANVLTATLDRCLRSRSAENRG